MASVIPANCQDQLHTVGLLPALATVTAQDLVQYCIVVGAIFLAFLAVLVVRRLALGTMKPRGPQEQLAELDRLYRQGSISQDEYQRGRRRILGVDGPGRADQSPPGKP